MLDLDPLRYSTVEHETKRSKLRLVFWDSWNRDLTSISWALHGSEIYKVRIPPADIFVLETLFWSFHNSVFWEGQVKAQKRLLTVINLISWNLLFIFLFFNLIRGAQRMVLGFRVLQCLGATFLENSFFLCLVFPKVFYLSLHPCSLIFKGFIIYLIPGSTVF